MPVLAGALLGVLAAWPAWWWLRRGTYRRDDDRALLGSRDGRAAAMAPLLLASVWGIAGATSGFVRGWGWLVVGAYLTGGVLVCWTDLDVHRIPDRVTVPWALVVALASVVVAALGGNGWLLSGGALGALAYGALFLLLAVVGSLGLGDVKLAVVSGWVLGVFGWPWLLVTALIATLATGAAVAVALLLAGRSRTAHMPFGPPLVLGTAVALLLDAARLL